MGNYVQHFQEFGWLPIWFGLYREDIITGWKMKDWEEDMEKYKCIRNKRVGMTRTMELMNSRVWDIILGVNNAYRIPILMHDWTEE